MHIVRWVYKPVVVAQSVHLSVNNVGMVTVSVQSFSPHFEKIFYKKKKNNNKYNPILIRKHSLRCEM